MLDLKEKTKTKEKSEEKPQKCGFCTNEIDFKLPYVEIIHFECKGKRNLANFYHIKCFSDAIHHKATKLMVEQIGHIRGMIKKLGGLPQNGI